MQKSRSHLHTQLESYSVASKGLRLPNWKNGGTMLATVAGSALAMATNANASIIYSGIQNVTASRPAGNNFTDAAAFTIGGAAAKVFAYNANGSRRSTASAYVKVAGGNFLESNAFAFNVKRLASGATISTGQIFGNGHNLRRKNNYSFTGQFFNPATGFAGVKFLQGVDTHYGWIRLQVNIGPANAVTTTAIDWAYNDVAGQSITAGEGVPSAAPEPSTTSMALLAAGSAGVLAWRKRRKQIAA